MRREDGRRRMKEGGRRSEDGGRRMEDSRQNLRTEFRAATESSGLAGFGLASVEMLGAEWRQARFPSGFEDSRSR
jgi:hypothetical protein